MLIDTAVFYQLQPVAVNKFSFFLQLKAWELRVLLGSFFQTIDVFISYWRIAM